MTGVGVALAVDVLDDGPVTALDGSFGSTRSARSWSSSSDSSRCIATAYGVGYVRAELDHGHTTAGAARASYGTLVQLFVAAMLIAVLADNLGVMWVAIEATTIATAFLVGHRRTRASLEASWKYVVIGSVGIALAFLGTVLVYFASRHAGGERRRRRSTGRHSVDARADASTPACVRLAVGLLVLGYGTKVGLGADAHLAARRAQPGPRARVGAHVRRVAVGRVLRAAALQGHRRRRARPELPAWPARRRRRCCRSPSPRRC